MRKLLYFVMILGILMLSLSVVVAQDANWCNPGGPWGDGRCNNPDPFVASYYWEMGWCMANDVDPAALMASSVVPAAFNDSYSKEEFKSYSFNYVPASEGLLANDLGEGIEIISYSDLSRGGDLLVWSDGSFRIRNAKPGEHTFTYTITGGETAEVTVKCRK